LEYGVAELAAKVNSDLDNELPGLSAAWSDINRLSPQVLVTVESLAKR